MANEFKLEMPKGTLSKIKNRHGTYSMKVEWAPGVEELLNKKLSNVQAVIDSEVLRLCDPYVPKETGILIRSGIMNTIGGSGEVVYETPYARKQYYIPMEREGQRTSYWFEHMKANGGKEKILSVARKALKK